MSTDRTTPAAYTIAEACAVAGIRRTTLYKEIRAGDLRAVKIGGRTVILVDDLTSLASAGRRSSLTASDWSV